MKIALATLILLACLLNYAVAAALAATSEPESPEQVDSLQQMPPTAPPIQSQYDGDLDAMENRFFAHEFASETPQERLDRIERLVYGSRKSGSVPERVSRLLLDVPNLSMHPASDPDAYTAQEPLSKSKSLSPAQISDSSQSGSPNYSTYSEPDFNSGNFGLSLSAEVSDMEKKVFGKEYRNEPLVSRVSRIENAVFAGQTRQTFSPLVMRINRLLAALEPQFKSTTGSYVAAKKSDKKGHPIMHKLGKFLAGVGTVAGETLGAVAAGSMMGYGYGYGYGFGGYGFGYPGMYYPGYYGMGFGPRPFMGYW